MATLLTNITSASRVSSYLSGPSTRSIQATVLITYFLMDDNHASDGWAFSGLLIRQAYTMGLNRDPSIIVPHATPFEKQQRLKLKQAVLHLGESTADPIYLRAREDIMKTVEILQASSEHDVVAKDSVSVLNDYL
ncbi:MAG: hypothetical protein M1830_004717 [Pleopsidium flavum]|nr:MAG: hypothetical protein M1830_004717 [Pleopsidium flavum]